MIAGREKHQLWRLGSIAIFCGLPLLLLGLIVTDAMDALQSTTQAARKRATTSMIVAQLEKHRVRHVTPADTASLYLDSASDTLARAEIQERATRLVSETGGQLAEVQLTATPEQEAQGTVAIQLSLEIGNKELLDLLFRIESGLPLLDVTELSVQMNNRRRDDDGRTGGALHVDMTLAGHWRKSAG